MRLIPTLIAATLFPLPSLAWEFSAGPICTLTHSTPEAEVTVTYDASLPEYAIEIRLIDGTWAAGPVYSIAFEGGRSLTISTDRHRLSQADSTLTVRDRGFGNVLDGLEFNDMAIALSGQTAVAIPLTGAAGAVQAFRQCPATVTS